jgi:F-type H+-transporting ATPase subunit delta
MTSAAVVNRYAGALVEVVMAPGKGMNPQLALSQLRSFEAALRETPALGIILASPAVPKTRKQAVIRRIADALGADRLIRNFLLVLSDHHRAGAIAEVINTFDVLLDERLGFVRAEVQSASALTDEQRARLTQELARLAGHQVRTRFTVDPDLIGGVAAKLGSKVYDGSVRGQLAKLRQRLVLQ